MAKKKIEDPFTYLNNFFTSDENMKNLFNALVIELMESMEEQSKNAPVTYGVNFTMKNGAPSITQSGGIKIVNGTVRTEEREPLVEVLGNERQISVIAEVPGANKSDIKLKYEPAILEISAAGKDTGRNYFKKVTLPYHMEARRIKAKYTNGVLEVTIRRGNKKVNSEYIAIE
ncbi:MAG: Hsp20/alpha crystallin family protein [Candidatus Micrarchaeales archaeon]